MRVEAIDDPQNNDLFLEFRRSMVSIGKMSTFTAPLSVETDCSSLYQNGIVSARIIGTGSVLARRLVTNTELSQIVNTTDDWIVERTGIRQRYYCDECESSATLAIEASRLALKNAEVDPRDVDLIICATVTPERMTPSNASQIQAALGCQPVPAFDVSSACSGFMFALGIAQSFLVAKRAETVLVVGAEALSRALDFCDRNSCVLFGDGAGAIVLSSTNGTGRLLTHLMLNTDSKRNDLIQVPSFIPKSGRLDTDLRYIRLRGPETYRFAIQVMSNLLNELKQSCSFEWNDIAAIIPHQVNRRVFEVVACLNTHFPTASIPPD